MEGTFAVTVSIALENRHAYLRHAHRVSEIDGVLDDVDLGVEIGNDVDRGVSDDERIGMAGHVHDEAVADPAFGANAAFPGDHGGHEFVGMEAALHQRLELARRDEADRLRR